MGVLSLLYGDEIAVLPYIGISLTDLIFTEDGNPSFFVDSKSSEKGDPSPGPSARQFWQDEIDFRNHFTDQGAAAQPIGF
jgi:hypothetical protein